MKQTKPIHLVLTEEEVNGCLLALGELPAKHSIGLILKIQEQAKPQLKSREAESVNVPEESE